MSALDDDDVGAYFDDFDWSQVADEVRLVEYPKESVRRHIVTGRDAKTLRPGNFLNDSIIDFYLKYLETEGLGAEIPTRVHFFSCFFYKRLVDEGRKGGGGVDDLTLAARRHDRVKSWTKNVDLFTRDFIVIPVNKGAHWFLVLVCFPADALVNNNNSSETAANPVGPLIRRP